MGVLRTLWVLRKTWIIIFTPLLLLPLLLKDTQESAAAYCLILMAVYWATEAFPIAVTALLPVMLFPMTGLMSGKQVSKQYINDSSMLFVGGLIMAVAVEHWNIHKRIALRLLLTLGTQPTRLMFGMMLPAWFLSMWLNNMATTAMMCPIADALLKELEHSEEDTSERKSGGIFTMYGACSKTELTERVVDIVPVETDVDQEIVVKSGEENSVAPEQYSKDKNSPETEKERNKDHHQLGKAMTISIAYAANIGGTTTITGCSSNIILKGMADQIFNERGLSSGISFGTWLVLGFPISLLIFIALFLWLQLYFRGCRRLKSKSAKTDRRIREYIQREYDALGSFTFPEVTVLILFLVLIVLWVSRDLGGAGGWGNIFKSKYVTDSAAPTLVSALLFFIPANLPDFFKKKNRPTNVKTLLTWRVVHEKVPWGLFLLFGGGFALAEGCKISGLSGSIREALTVFRDVPSWLTCFLVALLVSMVTEVVTNTATCTLVLPIIAELSIGIGSNPLLLMIPTAVATSYAYMLPVATPPNAMVYVLGYFSIPEMIKAGLVMDIISVAILTLGVNTWGAAFFDLNTLPPEFIEATALSVSGSNLTTPIVL